jgi:hypothetical protein
MVSPHVYEYGDILFFHMHVTHPYQQTQNDFLNALIWNDSIARVPLKFALLG